MDNSELIGKIYRNGPDGGRYRVLHIIDDVLVGAERISDKRPVAALADFVCKSLEG